MLLDEKKSVWIAATEFPPQFPGGGISAYCENFARALVEQGHNVVVFARAGHHQTKVESIVHQVGYDVCWVPTSTPEGKLERSLGHFHLFSYNLALAMLERLRDERFEKPSFIEVQEHNAVGYFLQKWKQLGEPLLQDIPIVVVCHTPTYENLVINEQPSYQFPFYWLGRSEKYSLLAADLIVSPSNFLAKKIETEIGRTVAVSHLPNFAIETAQGLSSSETKTYDLLYVGRYELRKGVLELISALKKLWGEGHRIKLCMVGGDTFWAARNKSIKEIIQQSCADYIETGLLTLKDALPREEIPILMGDARAIVLPSRFENYPLVCMEAMTCGLPVICSRTGGHAEMVQEDEAAGYIFDHGDKDSLKNAISKFMALDPIKQREMGRTAKDRISEISCPKKYVDERLGHVENLHKSDTSKSYAFLNQLLPNEPKVPAYEVEQFPKGEKGLLSVVIPYYNLGEFLEETISSLVAADYEQLEVVIVNDGSTDLRSIEVLECVRNRDYAFKLVVVDIENAGLANARNVGAELANGEFLSFLDADDTVRPTYYSRCVEQLRRNKNASFVYSWVQFFGGANDIWTNFDTEFPFMLGANMLSSYQVMRRDDYLKFGINDIEMSLSMEDYEAWLRMVGHGCLGISIPEVLVDYRVREDSMSRSGGHSKTLLMRERIVTKNRDLFNKWGADLAALKDANGPGYLWGNGTFETPPVTYAVGETAPNRLSALRWKFSPENLSEIAQMLENPAVTRAISIAMRLKLHKLVIRTIDFAAKTKRFVVPRR